MGMFWQAHGQNQNEFAYDKFYDTLLIINGQLIDQDKVLVLREDFTKADTLRVNQKGLVLESFSMQAISLGTNVSLYADSPLLTTEMINLVLNGATKYKFIYLKDIILRSKDGRKLAPSTETIKIIFTN
jgi:hypothetical protein